MRKKKKGKDLQKSLDWRKRLNANAKKKKLNANVKKKRLKDSKRRELLKNKESPRSKRELQPKLQKPKD